MPAHTFRQAALAVLAANAIKPFVEKNETGAMLSFAAGWPTAELAPQLLGLGVLDTLVSARRGRVSPAGLALSAAAAAGLTYLTVRARRAESRLSEAIAEMVERDERHHTSARTVARPFAFTDHRVEVVRDIAYVDGSTARKARLDVYRPADEVPKDAPVLVQVHGGGWTIGTKEQQGLLLMNRMAARGWVCVAVNYRLAPKYPWPTQITDVKRALAWVHEHIAEYGGDPSYVAITGGSAGGHLAALAALTAGDPELQPGFESADTSVDACVPFYGVYDMAGDDGDHYAVTLRDQFLRGRLFAEDAPIEDFRAASPLYRVTPDAPDFFVIHGDIDTMVSVRQARAFVTRLREVSKASVSYAELPGGQHAFDIFGSIRSHHAVRAVQRWLEWHRATWLARASA